MESMRRVYSITRKMNEGLQKECGLTTLERHVVQIRKALTIGMPLSLSDITWGLKSIALAHPEVLKYLAPKEVVYLDSVAVGCQIPRLDDPEGWERYKNE